MSLKIRLRQQGRRNRLTYRLVVTEATARRDGKYLENLGHFDPHVHDEKQLSVHSDRVQYWLDRGAQLTEKAEALVKRMAPEVIQELHKKKEEKRKALSAKRKAKK